MIGKDSTLRAIGHLKAFGDTDIFPRLPEIRFLEEAADEIGDEIAKLTVGTYHPQSAIELLVPKSSKSFRIAHQLTAIDTLLYTASLIENAASLETQRVDTSEGIAFAYRYQDGEGPRLFEVGTSFHDWLIKLCEFGGEAEKHDDRIVIETDISDFYQRIYFHRIENILDGAAHSKAASVTKKIIKSVRANQSFGIPVGQTASRVLAEMVLNDTDQFLLSEGVAHTRYVDDFRIIVENQTVAHATLCKLAEHLMITEGLSLNGEKTSFSNVYSVQKHCATRVNDVFNSPEMKQFENYLKITYEDDPTLDDAEDDTADLIFFDADNLVDKIVEMEEYGGKEISTFKALLRAIRTVGDVDAGKLLSLDPRYLYLIPRDYCLAFTKVKTGKEEEIRAHFLRLLHEIPYSDLTICRYWILSLFVSGALPFSWDDFRDYDFTRSTAEKRCELFLRGRTGQVTYFRTRKTRFGELSDWERPAFLIGAMSLPKDEYEKWLSSVAHLIPGPVSRAFQGWLKANRHRLTEVLAI